MRACAKGEDPRACQDHVKAFLGRATVRQEHHSRGLVEGLVSNSRRVAMTAQSAVKAAGSMSTPKSS